MIDSMTAMEGSLKILELGQISCSSDKSNSRRAFKVSKFGGIVPSKQIPSSLRESTSMQVLRLLGI